MERSFMALNIIEVKKEVIAAIESALEVKVRPGRAVPSNHRGKVVLFLGIELKKNRTQQAVIKLALADDDEESALFREFEELIATKVWPGFVLSLRGISVTHLAPMGRDMLVYEVVVNFL